MKSTAALPHGRKDGLVVKELGNETLVYDLERDEAHCLNQTAALVWKTSTWLTATLKRPWQCRRSRAGTWCSSTLRRRSCCR